MFFNDHRSLYIRHVSVRMYICTFIRMYSHTFSTNVANILGVMISLVDSV